MRKFEEKLERYWEYEVTKITSALYLSAFFGSLVLHWHHEHHSQARLVYRMWILRWHLAPSRQKMPATATRNFHPSLYLFRVLRSGGRRLNGPMRSRGRHSASLIGASFVCLITYLPTTFVPYSNQPEAGNKDNQKTFDAASTWDRTIDRWWAFLWLQDGFCFQHHIGLVVKALVGWFKSVDWVTWFELAFTQANWSNSLPNLWTRGPSLAVW